MRSATIVAEGKLKTANSLMWNTPFQRVDHDALDGFQAIFQADATIEAARPAFDRPPDIFGLEPMVVPLVIERLARQLRGFDGSQDPAPARLMAWLS